MATFQELVTTLGTPPPGLLLQATGDRIQVRWHSFRHHALPRSVCVRIGLKLSWLFAWSLLLTLGLVALLAQSSNLLDVLVGHLIELALVSVSVAPGLTVIGDLRDVARSGQTHHLTLARDELELDVETAGAREPALRTSRHQLRRCEVADDTGELHVSLDGEAAGSEVSLALGPEASLALGEPHCAWLSRLLERWRTCGAPYR